MNRLTIADAVIAVSSMPAFAQAVIEIPTSTVVVVPPGAPGVVKRRPGSTGDRPATTHSPTARAADGIATDSAAAGDEGQSSRIGSTGSGGGE